MGYYSVNPMESFLQLKKVMPKGFTKGSGYISMYIPTHVTMQIFTITLLERGLDKKKINLPFFLLINNKILKIVGL